MIGWTSTRVTKAARYGACCVRLLMCREVPYRWATVWGYLKLHWLARVDPDRTKPVRLAGWRVSFGSLLVLRHVYREVFIERTYARLAPQQAGVILDVGANIGVAMLWYARRYPGARIVCFEPNPASFALLEENVRNNGLRSVITHQLAIADQSTDLPFYVDRWAPGGDLLHSTSLAFRAGLATGSTLSTHMLPAEPLDTYLDEPVDILKMDIEGAESAVLKAAAELLGQVNVVQMEYHYLPENSLAAILDALEGAGHSYEMHTHGAFTSDVGQVAMVYSRNRRPFSRMLAE